MLGFCCKIADKGGKILLKDELAVTAAALFAVAVFADVGVAEEAPVAEVFAALL